MAAGMDWVAQHVKRNGWRGVVNMSLGGPASTALNDAAQQLINAGIPVVTSAGNKYSAGAMAAWHPSLAGCPAPGRSRHWECICHFLAMCRL